ncbi:DUF4157 domain-containing protein [Deinococcus hohokamensis]|uniref:DUF4157 domain-containing protein n=1 Tax=Deinococcus hohokamensis TaxID=309883 RepID=A0ABV9IDK6_9DEIO
MQRLSREAQQQARLQQAVHRLTSRPVSAQRQAVQAPLRAATLDRQERSGLQKRQHDLQAQLKALALPPGLIEAAPAKPPESAAASPRPVRPATPGDWVAVMRASAEEVEGQRLDIRQQAQLTALQRQAAHQIAQGFRSDRSTGKERHETYGLYLAALQRHPLSAHVGRVVLGLIPPGERAALQRAVDTAVHRDQLQAAQATQVQQALTLQRQLADLAAEASQPLLQRIEARRGSGNPLPEAIRRHLEQGLNHDLSRVRIHDDIEADKLAKSVGAVAFTTGTDIYFRSGHFRPNTKSGLALLAHEVTHTVQQAQGRVAGGIDPDAGLESEAQVTGARLARTFTPTSFLKTPPERSQQVSRSLAPLTPSHAAQRLAVQRQGLQRSLWGDWWKGFQNKALEGALELAARVPNGQVIVSAFKRSQAVFQKIFANPGQFFSRLFTSVRNGFQSFRKNIAVHLKTALLDWLTGTTVAATGGVIAFPKSLDGKELLGFGMNLVGLNTGTLIARLGQRYGAANVHKVQGQLAVLQQARGGLHKLNEFRSLDSRAKDGMLSAAKTYAVQTVAQQAVVWVGGFLATGGLGPVAKAAFSLISTFLQNARTFGQVATGVLDSVQDIANGQTAGAARIIETNLGRVTGLVLKFVSRLLGLDKIGGALRRGLSAVQKPINTAIDRIVGSRPVQAVFQKLKGVGSAVREKAQEWWQSLTVDNVFTARVRGGTERHTVSFKPWQGTPRLTLASRELPLLDQFAELRRLATQAGTLATVDPVLDAIERYALPAETQLRAEPNKTRARATAQQLLLRIRQDLINGQVYLHVSSQLPVQDLPRAVPYAQARRAGYTGHHVPPVELAQQMLNAVRALKGKIGRSRLTSSQPTLAGQARQLLEDREQVFTRNLAGHGGQLMTIEISHTAHMYCTSKFGVHNVNLNVAAVQSLLDQEAAGAVTQETLLITRPNGGVAASFKGQDWAAALGAVRQRMGSAVTVTGKVIRLNRTTSSTEQAVEDILQQFRLVETSGLGNQRQVRVVLNRTLAELNDTFVRTQQAALPMGLRQVAEALKTSLKDGPHPQHAAILNAYPALAQHSWASLSDPLVIQ